MAQEQAPAKIAPIVPEPKGPATTKAPAQTGIDVLQALLDQLREANKPVDTIEVPGKADIKPVDGAKGDSKPAKDDSAAKAAARSSGAVVASPSDVVTNAILNQGQLIQSSSRAVNTGIDAKLSDVLATLDKVSQKTDEAANKKDSGGGFLGTILDIGSKIFGFL